MVAVNPSGGFNSYWPMPFRKHARITVENQRPDDIPGFFYQITYSLEPVPEGAAYFTHPASLLTTRTHPEHTIVDGIEGAATTWAPSLDGSSSRTAGGARAK